MRQIGTWTVSAIVALLVAACAERAPLMQPDSEPESPDPAPNCDPDTVVTGPFGSESLPINDQPAWSPDGEWIAFTRRARNEVEAELGWHQLWKVSVEDGTEIYLGQGASPSWSPTMSHIAYALGPSVWILELGTGSTRQLTDFEYAFQPRWGLQSNRILIMRWNPAGELWTVSPDGGDITDLGYASYSADWSPDGQMIVFGSHDERELYIGSASDPAEFELLARSEDFFARYPRWSPTGEWIAYYRIARGSGRGVALIRPNGEDDHLVLPLGERASWSPDGESLVYEYPAFDERCQLRVHTLATGESRPLLE